MAERTVSVRLKAVIDDYKRAMGEAGQATTDFTERTRQIGEFGKSTAKLGDSLTRNVTLPIVALGGMATKMAADFDGAFVRMQTLAGVSAKEVEGLKESVLDLAGETGRAPQELGEALYFLSSSGLDSAQAMDALEMSAKASAAGMGSTIQIADAVSSAMNAYAVSNLSAAEATDVLVATARAGKVEPAELASQMGRLVPISSELGITFGEVGGAIAVLSQKGNDASTSTTQLSAVMLKLVKPSQQALEMLEGVGLSLDDLHAMIADKGLLATLEELKARLGDNGFLKFMEDQQAILGVNALLGGDLKETKKIMDSVTDSVGATDEAFGKWADSMGAENARAFADFQIALIRLGDIIAPIAANVLSFAAGIAEAFSSLPEWAQNAAVGMLALVAAIGPVLSVGGRMITIFSTLLRLLANMAVPDAAIRGLGSSATAAGGGVGFLRSAATGLAIMLPALAVAGYGVARMMQENAEEAAKAKERVDALTDAMKRQADGADGAVAEQAALLLAVGDVGEGLRKAGADMDVFTDALISGSDELQQLPDSLDELGDADAVIEDMAKSGSDLGAELVRLRDSGKLSADQMVGLLFGLRALSDDFASATQATENEEFAQEEVAAAYGETATSAQQASQAIKDFADQLAAQFDPLFGLIDAQHGLVESQLGITEAQANLDAVLADSESTAEDVAEAQRGLEEAQWAGVTAAYGLEQAQIAAAQAAAEEGLTVDEARRRGYEWAAQAGLTGAAADAVAEQFANAASQGAAYARNYSATVGISGVGSAISDIAAIQDRINSLHGRDVGIRIVGTSVGFVGSGFKVFHEGGFVPGPRGQEVAAILQAGERVLSLDDPLNAAMSGNVTAGPGGGFGGGVTMTPVFNFYGPVASQADAERWVAQAWNRAAYAGMVNVRGRRV